MSFVDRILGRLRESPDHVFLQEAADGELRPASGADLVSRVGRARAFARSRGLAKGDRCALLGANSIAWVAADLGLMAEGVVVVPLYGRQKASELVGMMKDCTPKLLLCGTGEEREAIRSEWPDAPPTHLLEEALGGGSPAGADEGAGDPWPLAGDDPVTLIYTSGTSGEPKGVVLTRANVDFMLRRTRDRVDVLMRGHAGPERVFHYLPFCFAGSWILLLLSLSRRATLTLNTDLARIVDDVALARPHYFQNVPVLLERMRSGIEEAIAKRGGLATALFEGALRAVFARANGETPASLDAVKLAAARQIVFPSIRRKIGAELRALICGSAALSRDTQLFFEAIGVPVLQVYGLTETTAICTMDFPGRTEPGRVGRPIEGVEMRLGEHDEILVKGANLFAGYWNRPDATAAAFADGWLRTGDRGEVDETGNWRVLGRIKNLIVPSSGHNVAPEPIEERLAALLPKAAQIVLVGNERPHLAVLVTGDVTDVEVERTLADFNETLPHYRKIRASLVIPEPFTIESGLITANGKLRRDAVAARFTSEIDRLYAREKVPA